jgi:hypothetical protein
VVSGATGGGQIHHLKLYAKMTPVVWWIKVYDLEQRYLE